MDTVVTHYQHCSVVKTDGRIDSYTSPQLGGTLDQIQQKGQFKIVLDMEGVDFISSSGLRVLITTLKNCRKAERGDLVLARVPERILAALDLAGFTNFFKLYEDVPSAVNQF